ncbi:MAG: CcmD family protein [Chitinophagales bacterium]|nr:CcmD family protein [Chitinophagales bacterium]
MKKISTSFLLLFISIIRLQAQNNSAFENALNQSNKMIAVIIVLLVILLGIALFLFYLERRIKKFRRPKQTKIIYKQNQTKQYV